MKKPKLNPLVAWVNRLDAHYKLYISIAIALIAVLCCYGRMETGLLLMVVWSAFLASILMLFWLTMASSHPAEVRREAHSQDSSRSIVFLFVLVAAFASLFAVAFLISDSDGKTAEFIVPLVCVIGSWWLVHTVFTLRYAHFYYCDVDHEHMDGNRKPGGLDFPGEKRPDYLDFAYFSFVVGMTFQVSDVQITSRRIRRLAWVHGLLSFAFNTFIVAFAINVLSGLISK